MDASCAAVEGKSYWLCDEIADTCSAPKSHFEYTIMAAGDPTKLVTFAAGKVEEIWREIGDPLESAVGPT